MKTIFFEMSEEESAQLKKIAPSGDFTLVKEKLSEENISLAKDAQAVCVFINSKISKEIIDQLPNLKFITTRSMGFDHIDAKYAKSKGILVSNVPAYGARTVAEFTFSLILGLSRKTFFAYSQVKNRHDFDFTSFKGFDLQGKTLGVIGTGRIGMSVIEIAIKGFGMKVAAFDSFPNTQKAEELKFSYMKLEEVLAQSDIITIHVPYNEQTRHLINRNNIKQVKPGALLINTARGEVIETEAIAQGIADKILAGVGLDVLEGERELKEEWSLLTSGAAVDPNEIKILLEDHILMSSPEAVITPHIAFFTQEARMEILQTTVDNLFAFENKAAKNLVIK